MSLGFLRRLGRVTGAGSDDFGSCRLASGMKG